jgi:polyisoprenoid-binding protein YceI
MRTIMMAAAVAVGLMVVGCDDAAKGKTQAQVAAPLTEGAKPAGSETLAINGENSKVEFTGAKVTGSHPGGFKTFTGTIDYVPGKIEASKVTVEIDVNSLYTDQEKLTGHLKTAELLDATKFPKATFTTTEIKAGGASGATHTLTGNLELHGVKKSISFPAKVMASDAAVEATAEFVINRKDFGIVYPGKPDDLIKDDVVIKLTLKAPRKK